MLSRKQRPLTVVGRTGPDPAAPADPGASLAEQALAHADELYGLARHLCATTSDAEDIVQETYARALGGVARLTPGSNLRAWLFRILRNCFIDQARRKKIVLEIADDTVADRPAHEVWDTAALDQLRYLAAAVATLDEIVGDHLRIVGSPRPLDVESNDMHNVKPWFTGKLDFVPPVNFVGDGEFHLRGGALAVFQGHKAAAFVHQRRLHTITLLVHADAAAGPRAETTRRGFHVISWASGGIGLALVSDIGWDDLRQLEARLGSASGEKE